MTKSTKIQRTLSVYTDLKIETKVTSKIKDYPLKLRMNVLA